MDRHSRGLIDKVKPTLYIETTVVSYLTARPTRDVIMMGRQQVTQMWWQRRLADFAPTISQLVLDEAARGDADAARLRCAALARFALLNIDDRVLLLARRFIRPGALPIKAGDDAVHLALCAVHQVSFLLTWNFRHIANAETAVRLRQICLAAGYDFPTICTPDELMKGPL